MSTRGVRRTQGVPVEADFYNSEGTPIVVDTTNGGLYPKKDDGIIVNFIGHICGDFQVLGES